MRLKYLDHPMHIEAPNLHIIHAERGFLGVYVCQVIMGLKVESASVLSRYLSPDRMKVAEIEAKFGLQGLTVPLADEVQDGVCHGSTSYQSFQLYKMSKRRQLRDSRFFRSSRSFDFTRL